ncbi:DUF4349 domain-containing protein [Cellulomonas soli]|uniref:DUF4349 domain-containing protein n=1 Tax=Cellulomonas soli TaxID=931535 RepID=UPI003F83BC05
MVLDTARAAAGAPSTHREERTDGTPRARRPRRALPLAVALGVAAALAGCSAGGDSSTVGQVAADQSAVDGDAGSAGAATEELAVGGTQAAADARQVVQTGTVWMTSPDPVGTAAQVVTLTEGLQGRVDSRHSVAGGDDRQASASLVVRVPADELTALLDGLGGVGEVVEQSVQSQDVTADAQDLDARIRAMQLSVARMEDLLARATTNEDLVTAEQALTDRQSSLEQMQSQRARLAEQVALSTVTVELTEPGEVPAAAEPAPEGFLGGLSMGWASLVGTLGTVVLVIGVLAPWLAFAGAVGAGAVAVSRWWHRRAARRPGAPAVTRPAPAPVAAPVEAREDD